MKLSVAIFPLAIILGGCTTGPVMRPEVNIPSTSEVQPEKPKQDKASDTDSPCLDKAKDLANKAADVAEEAYQGARDSGLVDDAKEVAKRAGKYLHKKAVEYHEAAKDAVK